MSGDSSPTHKIENIRSGISSTITNPLDKEINKEERAGTNRGIVKHFQYSFEGGSFPLSDQPEPTSKQSSNREVGNKTRSPVSIGSDTVEGGLLQDSEESEEFICPAERLAGQKLVNRKKRRDPHNRLPYQDGIQSAIEHKHFMYKAHRGNTNSNAHLNVVRHNTKQNLPTVMSQYDSKNT